MATRESDWESAAKKEEVVVTLMSSDGESFEVEAEAAAALSVTIRHAIAKGCTDRPISLPIVGASALAVAVAVAVEYCHKHYFLGAGAGADSAVYDDELRTFDEKLVKVDRDALFDLIEAASYLEIEGLLNLMCRTVAEMIKGKSVEELRRTFDISNDYTSEEEEEVRREVSWALD